ncbi:MAG: tetratricopeptide repeat protein [Bacteroidales bacterium]|nr:tetratricopeptide repeat protein [Bacteroidales bacterium]
MRRVAFILFLGLLSFKPQLVIGQDQRVADSLAVIYQEDILEGKDKLELLRGLSFNELNDGSLSLKYAEELIRLSELENNSSYLFSGYLQKGEYYKKIGDLDFALEIYYKAVNIALDSKSIKDEGIAYISIADVYSIMENYGNAVKFYDKSIQILRSTADSIPLASALLNAGDCYYTMGEYDKAMRCFEEAGPIFQKKNYLTGMAYNLGNIGMIYAKQGKDTLAENNISEAIAILEELEDYYPISVYLTIMSDIYLKQDDFNAALNYTLRSLELASAYGLKDQIGDAYLQLSQLYEQKGNQKEAFSYYKSHILYRDSVRNIEAIQQMANVRTDFELAEKQIEVDLLTQKRKNQQTLSILSALAVLLFILLAIGLYRRYTFIKHTNVKIRTQRDEIESQRDEVEAQRDLLETHRDLVVFQKNEIIESINYAKRIQSAMLPPEAYFSELLNESFIFYKPRDIVSGDFYWIKKVDHFIVMAVADCTGHGVPGAFMSMLGMSYLNEIAQRKEILQANQVLNELRKQIKYSLRQGGERDESKDGIDMALCVLDLESKKMQYAGANIPLYLIKDVKGKPEFMEIKADRMPLGYYQSKDVSFVNHDVQLDRGDALYMFSDGFIDQKGGPEGKKFLSKNFKNLLLDVHTKGMSDQKEILDKTLADWMGEHSQIDDILVVGVKI